MRGRRGPVIAVPLLLLAALAASPAAAVADESADGSSRRLPGVMVVDSLFGTSDLSTSDGTGPIPAEHPIGALQLGASGAVTSPAGGFTICHDSSVPAAVLDDVVAALEEWSATLSLSGPTIVIDFGWTPLNGDGSLGVAGPTEFIVNPQLPLPTTGYPMALANELLGTDLNGPGCGDANSEMALFLNSTAGGDGSLWNIGDDDATDNQVDLSTVVLHEVGHGLGIVSSARLVNNVIEWPRANSPAYVYDHFFGECVSESATGCDADITALASSKGDSLRGAQLWFRSLGGRPLELHAPTDWSGGSSVSHLDEVRYPASSGFSLMTPYLRRGETFSAVDPALQSLVQTLGWTLSRTPAAPGSVAATAGNGRIDVTFERPSLGSGAPATGFRVSITSGSRVVRSIETVAGSLSVAGLANGAVHQVSVVAVNTAGASTSAGPTSNRLIPLELPPFATTEAAAGQLYRDLLGITPSASELAAVAGRLRSTSLLGTEAQTIAADQRLERRLQVVRLYLGFFERDPDPAGIKYWFGEVSRGVNLDVVASSFAIASEFEQGQVIPDAEFIDAAYGRILDRAPDAAGRAYWQTQLGRGLDRGQMLILFSESAEHVAKTRVHANLVAITFGMLERSPTSVEEAQFATLVERSGAPGLAAHLVVSNDYDVRHRPR